MTPTDPTEADAIEADAIEANATEADANSGAGHPASLDEAPTFTTRQHLEYLVGLIIDHWKKTMVKWHNASADAFTGIAFDELVFPNFDEDTVIKFRVDKVPDAIHHKVDALQHMQRIGLPHLPALVELLKEELAKEPFAHDPDESGDENEASFTGMVSSQPFGPSCVLPSNVSACVCSSSSLPRSDYLRNMSRKRTPHLT